MNKFFSGLLLVLVAGGMAETQAAEAALPQDYSCTVCHARNGELWNEHTPVVEARDMVGDLHWQKGMLCHDCHGGSPTIKEFQDHRKDPTFRATVQPNEIPAFCGHCHGDAEYMKKFDAAAPVDLVERFWQSAHGQALLKAGGPPAAGSGQEARQEAGQKAGEHPLEAQASADVQPAGASPEAEPAAPADEAPVELPPEIARQLVTCTSCHPHHTMRSPADPQSVAHPSQLVNTCGTCHPQQRDLVLADIHGQAGPKNELGAGTALSCNACHGKDVHGLLPVKDRRSPVFVNNQVESCGQCHEPAKLSYLASIHGQGLQASGLVVTAVCANCHGAHGILPAKEPQSLLHSARVADTCGVCHRFIEERLKTSIHGSGNGPGGASPKVAPGGDTKRTPSCSDCHQKHDAARPGSPGFGLAMANRCGNCHDELSEQFAISIHGSLTELGYTQAAKCADCHGSHEIRALSDPQSLLSNANRAATCGKCHPGASGNFLDFDPHADHRNRARSPLLYYVYLVLLSFIFGTFGFFGTHSLLWFVRSLIDVLRHGRPEANTPGAVAYVRFTPFHRIAHTLLLISFLGLSLTGLPLKYSQTEWAHFLADLLGGFGSTSVWHRIFGCMNLGCLAIYIVRMLSILVKSRRRGATLTHALFGPDSPLPTWRDLKDMFRMVRWFFGLGPKPTFERWAYWEKFDFWGASADTVIIGLTGLILWFPHFTCLWLPGETLNLAKVIHSTQALLATAFVFAMHFFATHLRPEKFPMDMVILTGLVSEEEMHHERPELLDRLHREGKLDALRTTIPSRHRLWMLFLVGLVALSIGLSLLAGILIGVFGG